MIRARQAERTGEHKMIRTANLRDIRERVFRLKTHSVDVLPLVAVHRRPNVVGHDLCLVEQILYDENDGCTHARTHTETRKHIQR